MLKVFTATAAVAGLVAAGVAFATPASAQPCVGPNGNFAGNGGGRCDYPPDPDGSFVRCDTVYVLGFGGTNCYRVGPDTPRL